jgi:ubiquinol-cytochrome c reductase cytochrome b subunit
LISLLEAGSGNPTGISADVDKVPFHPYYTYKDLVGFFLFILLFISLISYNPTYFLHSDHFIPANPLVTPTHIVPE